MTRDFRGRFTRVVDNPKSLTGSQWFAGIPAHEADPGGGSAARPSHASGASPPTAPDQSPLLKGVALARVVPFREPFDDLVP